MRPVFRSTILSLTCAVGIALVGSSAALPAQSPADDAAFMRASYGKREVRIPMRDGVRLFTAIYTPRDASPARRYPIVLQRTPFSIAPYGAGNFPKALGPDPFMMREKYVFVYQDVRGRYLSEGTFVNARPFIPDSIKAHDRRAVDEASDSYDTIAWLLENVPNNNGRVGQWGISYPGFYASMGMLSRHPALVASSPQAPVTDMFFEDFHHNGALTQAYFYAYPIFGVPRPAPTTEDWWLKADMALAAHDSPDDYAYQLSLGPISTFGDRFYEGDTFWRDIVDHPNYDAYWQSRAVPPVLRGIRHAVLVVGGWFDAEDLYGPLAVYKTLLNNDPQAAAGIVMGPWRHHGWDAQGITRSTFGDIYYGDSLEWKYQRDVEAPFFRARLKGVGKDSLPGALMFDTGAKQWRRFARWPAPSATARSYYLHADGSLSTRAPSGKRAAREYSSDPLEPVPARCKGRTIEDFTLLHYMNDDQRCFDRRPDVLTYETDVLEEDVTIGGEILAKLAVSTTGTDADYVVKLIDVYPDDAPNSAVPRSDDGQTVRMAGYQQLVRGEIMRARFRDSFTTPRPMTPDSVTRVDVRLQDVLHTFMKGHRIMVQVQSSWFPAFDRNPQSYVPSIYKATAKDFVKATERVWDGSRIEVGVVRR